MIMAFPVLSISYLDLEKQVLAGFRFRRGRISGMIRSHKGPHRLTRVFFQHITHDFEQDCIDVLVGVSNPRNDLTECNEPLWSKYEPNQSRARNANVSS